MKRLVLALDRSATPVLLLVYVALCVTVLAVSPEGTGLPVFFAMLWTAVLMGLLRWGVWGVLCLAGRGRRGPKGAKVLTYTAEVLFLLLTGYAVAVSTVLSGIPSVWLSVPVTLFGVRGALRYHAQYLV